MTGLLEKMQKELPESRFTHVLGVVEEAHRLAKSVGCTSFDTLLRAAALHDCTKPFTYEEHLRYFEKYSYPLSEDDLRSPEVLHALTGALRALYEFGEAEETADLIRCHTTGKACMSTFEKILFISDYTEKNRRHETCRNERATLHTSLEKAETNEERLKLLDASALRILENTVFYLNEKKVFIHPNTISAIDFLKS